MTRISIALFLLAGCVSMATVGCGPYEYDFKETGDIKNIPEVELPLSAVDIHLVKTSARHVAIFTVERADLEAWVNELRALKPELNSNPESANWLERYDQLPQLKQDRQERIELERGKFNSEIGSITGFSERLLKYGVSRSERGGHTTLWYDPVEKRAYLSAVYW